MVKRKTCFKQQSTEGKVGPRPPRSMQESRGGQDSALPPVLV